MRLQEYLAQSASREFIWGKCDCALWVADGCLAMTGQDPAADYRGRYASRFEANQLLMRKGGFVSLVSPGLERCGWEVGEGYGVGVIQSKGLKMAAFIVSDRALVKIDRGYSVLDDFDVLRGWICPKL